MFELFCTGNMPHAPISPCKASQPDSARFSRRECSASIGSQNALIPDPPKHMTLDILRTMDDKYADIDHITASEDMSEAAKVC